ncbi:hypothetical protein CPAR01_09109 [Colletotrichum paranaense]|uniref:Uncharacterized protein n=1 Tax=Colletotrichum paranaense TaxID=1914294 RepID=A0ABQ9SFT9_9PEZI|nr:uncharacterized protein CPAR01_09109 [Colletotrichum paranaense]KAK1535567.1 hypothetical protein CPAR01_09109 [Colletotrichum paranaense]
MTGAAPQSNERIVKHSIRNSQVMYSIGDGVNAYWVFECFAYIGGDNEGNTAAQVMSWMGKAYDIALPGSRPPAHKQAGWEAAFWASRQVVTISALGQSTNGLILGNNGGNAIFWSG